MITAALLGNPNVGKTTLFNLLTGSNQYVGNWAGVTVEKKEGYIGSNIKIVDLPGIYAMDTYSNEEKVSKEFLQKEDVDVILNIVDASNLNRNLYLTMQLKEFKKPIVLLLNMIDIIESSGVKIDIEKLSEELGVKVIPIAASKGKGIDKVIDLLESSNFFNSTNDNNYQYQNEKEIYNHIDSILSMCVKYPIKKNKTISEKIDKIVLNKWLAYPIFMFIMFLIFEITFSWVGTPLADLFDRVLNEFIMPWVDNLLSGSSQWFKSLLVDGIISGVGSVVVFIPIILTLFLGISVLEDSGYMSRTALIMDRLMRKMGLSGKAFIPLFVGFGCSVPGIMSTKTLESEKDRKLTALLVPLMSCNARLPVYTLFASAFFIKAQSFVVISLYFIGVIAALVVGILFKNTLFKKDEEPFIIELPEYKLPELKLLLLHTWEKGKGFIRKAGTTIFAVSVIVWFLSNYNFSGQTDINNSFLALIGNLISPIFKPLGFGTWQNSVALLAGLMAKEVIVATMGVIYGGNLLSNLQHHFTPLSAYSFLIFVLLYTPCIATVITMKKEYGKKLMAISIIYQVLLAWIGGFLVYNVGNILKTLF